MATTWQSISTHLSLIHISHVLSNKSIPILFLHSLFFNSPLKLLLVVFMFRFILESFSPPPHSFIPNCHSLSLSLIFFHSNTLWKIDWLTPQLQTLSNSPILLPHFQQYHVNSSLSSSNSNFPGSVHRAFFHSFICPYTSQSCPSCVCGYKFCPLLLQRFLSFFRCWISKSQM